MKRELSILCLAIIIIGPIYSAQISSLSLHVNDYKDVASINIYPDVQYAAPSYDAFFLIRIDRKVPEVSIDIFYEVLYSDPNITVNLLYISDKLSPSDNSTYNYVRLHVLDETMYGEYDVVLNITINSMQYFRVLTLNVVPYPWGDSDFDEIPDYIDKKEFDVTRTHIEDVTMDIYISADLYVIKPSGEGDFGESLKELGALEPDFDFDNYFVLIIEGVNPFGTVINFLTWLSDHGLYNMSAHLDFFEDFLMSPDNVFRTMYVVALDNEEARIMANTYQFIGTSPVGLPINPIDRTPTYLDVRPNALFGDHVVFETSPSRVDKANKVLGKISDVVELIEEVVDFVNGNLKLKDVLKKIAGKIISSAIQWLITLILELLPTVITQIVGVIKLIYSIAGLRGIKKLLKKLGVSIPWWLDWMDPIGFGHIYMSVKNASGSVLGYYEVDGTFINETTFGLYFADPEGFSQVFLLSRSQCPYTAFIYRGDDIDPNNPPEYNLLIEDPGKLNFIGIWDTIMQNYSTFRVYLDDDELKVNRITGYVKILYPVVEYGSTITIEAYLSDENGSAINSGVNGYVYVGGYTFNFTQSSGKYVATIPTDMLNTTIYCAYMTFYANDKLSMRHYAPIEIVVSHDTMEDLNETIDNLNEQIDELTQNITDLQNTVDSLEQDVEALRQELSNLARNNWIYGGIGTVIGILIGMLVVLIKRK